MQYCHIALKAMFYLYIEIQSECYNLNVWLL